LRCHVSVVEYDYAGYGASTGKPSLPEILADGEAVYDYLVGNLKINPASIVLVGESLGSGVACTVAADRQCDSVILLSPFCSLMRLAKFKMWWLNFYPPSWFPYADIDNCVPLSGFQRPVLILTGTQDLTIPPSESKELAKVCRSGNLVEIPGRGHLVYYPPTPQYQAALANFLK
jgi:pimeloyl-ACP methyl ester carboxylesterase